MSAQPGTPARDVWGAPGEPARDFWGAPGEPARDFWGAPGEPARSAGERRPGESFIELGLAPPLEEDTPPPGRPHLPARLLLVVVALLTLVLAGSGLPSGPALPRLFTVPVSANPQYLLDNGSLYLFSGGAVSSYRLSDGRLRWRTPIDDSIDWFTSAPATRSLIANFNDGGNSDTAVFDMDTGALRWRRNNVSGQALTTGDSIILYDAGPTDPDQPVTVTAVALRSGEERWRRVLPNRDSQLVVPATPGTPSSALVVADDFSVLRIDLATGATLGRVSLPAELPELAAATVRYNSGLVGNVLMVSAVTAVGPRVFGFDAQTLQLRWSTTIPALTQYAGDCGAVICMYGDGGTTLLSPATGAVLATGNWQYAVTLPDGRLLAQSETVVVVDGQLHPLIPLGLWQVIATAPITLLARPGRDPGDTWIGLLDRGGAAVRPMAALHLGVVDSCGTDGSFLVCRASAGLVVFRLP